ncbi:MAG: hypothetical protein ACRDZ1_11175, partial [Acidimicrobiia bacterium]
VGSVRSAELGGPAGGPGGGPAGGPAGGGFWSAMTAPDVSWHRGSGGFVPILPLVAAHPAIRVAAGAPLVHTGTLRT